jgi:hypothetical protein
MKHPFEIGEISNHDAIGYLEEPRLVSEQAVLNITGGFFTSLNDFVSNYEEGKLDSRNTEALLLDLKIQPDHLAFRNIVGSEEVRKSGMSAEEIQRLISNNIFATRLMEP